MLGHAVHIAHYLYPKAYVAGASALLLGPTPDGRLFISGRRNQRTRLRALDDLPVGRAETLTDDTAARVADAAARLVLPQFAQSKAATADVTAVRKIATMRTDPLRSNH